MKLLCSDPHEQPFKEEKFLTQKKNFIERIIQYFASGPEKKKQDVFAAMKKVLKNELIDRMVINGDFCESSATERGMKEDKDLQAAREIRTRWSRELEIAEENMDFNGGNHEFGYQLPLGTDPLAGIYRKSVENFLKFANHSSIYHSFMAENFRVILVPYLFSEEKAVDFDLQAEKNKFLEKMKTDFENSERIIVFLHDPDSLDDHEMASLMRDYRGKIKGVFFGHYHAWINLFFTRIFVKIYNKFWLIIPRLLTSFLILLVTKEYQKVKAIGKYFRKRKNIPKLIKEFGAVLIPAPDGMFGIGGGFLTLDLQEDGTFKIEKHKI